MEQSKKDSKKIIFLILLLLMIAILSGILHVVLQEKNEGSEKTAVILKTEESLHDMEDGKLRIRINSAVQIYQDTMQDLAFANLNQGRLLQCKIRVGETCIYDSGLIQAGNVVQADVIDTAVLKKGKNTAMAEIYNYDMEQQLISQTNTVIDLYLHD